MRPILLTALVPLLALAVGCAGEKPYGVVEGLVTLDGKPAANVEVSFLPDPEKGNSGPRSVALTDKQGRFRIANAEGRAGAPVGMHRVCVKDLLAGPPGVMQQLPPIDPDNPGPGPVGAKPLPPTGQQKKLRFPSRYANSAMTPLRDIEVKEGQQTINVELRSVLPK
jgi:hypothetical protein